MAVIQTILVCLYIFLPTVDPQDAPNGAGDPGSEGKKEAAQMPPASMEDSPSFSDHARLTMRLTGLERRAPEMASVDVVGLSDEDRQVWMLRLARPGDRDPDERPAILVVAGLGATRV
ncbi:MAG: hypothetical protein O7D94_09960, partial [Planctomycetota bacterium]|nr:hypothetical protein [Planctomycetota bacterium]